MSRGATILDFSRAEPASALINYEACLHVGDVNLVRCNFSPNEGVILGASQFTVAVQIGGSYQLTTGQGSLRTTRTIRPGTISIWPASSPIYMAWGTASPRVALIAIAQRLVSRITHGEGLPTNTALSAVFGVRDRTMSKLVQTCAEQIDNHGAGGRSFAEGLAIAIATHAYRTYGGTASLNFSKGGLTPLDAQRVINYIEKNLQEDIGLDELASIVQLSTHYFTEAFRKTVGMPPYRFLLTRRIERAKALLLTSDLAPSNIAGEVGFSSQAQFTTNFRKFVGKTPGRFRRESS